MKIYRHLHSTFILKSENCKSVVVLSLICNWNLMTPSESDSNSDFISSDLVINRQGHVTNYTDHLL